MAPTECPNAGSVVVASLSKWNVTVVYYRKNLDASAQVMPHPGWASAVAIVVTNQDISECFASTDLFDYPAD
jgi:hypothetical protein